MSTMVVRGVSLESAEVGSASQRSAAIAAILFLHVSCRALSVHFSSDEMMNIYRYWEPGAWEVLRAMVLFWLPIIRPMGGLYYWPLFHAFGFNSWPYTVVRLAILLFVSLLLLRLAATLTGSYAAAIIAVGIAIYHPELVCLTHSGSYIYDILCGGFYFAALLYYLSRRHSGCALSLRQSCVFLALYLGALDSKEMAVSLPVIVCAYELLETPRNRRFLAHFWPVAAAALMTALFIKFKTYASEGLVQYEAYHPVFSWQRFTESSPRLLNAIFCTSWFRPWSVFAIWCVLAYIGIRKRDRRQLLLLVWVMVTPLPLNFIPPHGPGSVYILLTGWAMLVGMACEALSRRIAREPVFGWLPQGAAAGLVLACMLFYYTSATGPRSERMESAYIYEGVRTWNLIEQFRTSPVRPPHGSRILLLNDPFPEGWDSFFIAKLWWRDRSLKVFLQEKQHLPANAFDGMDYILDFPQGRLTRVR